MYWPAVNRITPKLELERDERAAKTARALRKILVMNYNGVRTITMLSISPRSSV